MASDFEIIERVRRETDIDSLRALFLKNINENESRMVELSETHSVEVESLEQQLSDSNAAIGALKEQVRRIRDMSDSDVDSVKGNARRLEGLVRELREENTALRSGVVIGKTGYCQSDLEAANASLERRLSRCEEDKDDLVQCLVGVKKYVSDLGKENRRLRQVTVAFIEEMNQSLGFAKRANDQALSVATDSRLRLQRVVSGLRIVKRKVGELRSIDISLSPIPFRSYKLRMMKAITSAFIMRNRDVACRSSDSHQCDENMSVNGSSDDEGVTDHDIMFFAGHAIEAVTGVKLAVIKTGSTFSLFRRSWEQQFGQLRAACRHFCSVYQTKFDGQKQKFTKRVKTRDLEIRKLNEEIGLMKTSRDLAREKIKALSSISPSTRKKSSKSHARSSVNQRTSVTSTEMVSGLSDPSHASVGTQSGLINMSLIRDRTIRHSKEAQLSVVQAELDRSREKNQKFLEQIGGLRRMVRRAGESANEENGRVRQTMCDLETQLREEKRSVQRRNLQFQRLQRDNEELAHAAAKVDPLKKCLILLFKNCHDRLEPLIAEQSIPEDLSELDELSQEIFNVPIHKICRPAFSRGFLKRQERKLVNAIHDSIEVEEIGKVFDTIIDEMQKRTRSAKDVTARSNDE